MARLPRFFIAETPLRVIQRGNNRTPIFCGPDDFGLFIRCLAHASVRHGVAIHAYVLMTNHFHLLVTPRFAASLPKTMQAVGRIYVQHFNERYGRTGTLWEGRYKAAIVEDERYLLTCMRYIELNPVRACIVARPDHYRWSSFQANAQGANDTLLAPHPAYRKLGRTAASRQQAYRVLFEGAIAEDDLRAIRDSTQNGWALGGAAFCKRIGATGRRAERLLAGRPHKQQP